MKVRTAYCSACDRNVRVVVKADVQEDEKDQAFDPHDLVCLEYGERCTGDMCPLFDVPTDQMRENLSRLADDGPAAGEG